MAEVYSKQLVNHAGFSGVATAAYTVPAGFVAVIRQMTIAVGANITPGAGNFRGPTLGVLFTFGPAIPTSGLQDAQRSGRWVLNEGESLYIETDGGWIADFFASGYELTLP